MEKKSKHTGDTVRNCHRGLGAKQKGNERRLFTYKEKSYKGQNDTGMYCWKHVKK